MARRTVIFLLLVWSLALASRPVAAQDPTPEPGPSAVKRLIDPATLGDGWSLHHTISPDALLPYGFRMSPDVFREGAAGIYTGPAGSRVIAVALLITQSRIAIRKSWEDATGLLGGIADSVFNVSVDWDRERELEKSDPPPECAEAKRIEGTEYRFGLPVGATMCAVDPDIILIAAVFGTMQDQSGVAASDAVIGLMIEPGTARQTSTPTRAVEASRNITIVAGKPTELQFDPSQFTIPAGTEVTVTLRNEGALPHNFSIDALNISVNMNPGETKEVTINASAGTYDFYCNVPGHREAGMTATLTVVDATDGVRVPGDLLGSAA